MKRRARSPISLRVSRGTGRAPGVCSHWVTRAYCWADIYLGSQEDIAEESPEQICYRYVAAQGDFALTLPRDHCYLMETDTTVELIAAHLTARIAERHPGRTVKVRAFEGVNKGALAFSGQ